MHHAVIVLLCVVAGIPALGIAADFNIENHCREVSQFVGGSYQIEQNCRNNERKAKEQLSAEPIPPEIEKHCAEVAEFVGGSYQLMMSCVKNETKAKANLH